MEIMDPGTQLTFLWRLVSATESGSVKWAKLDDYKFGVRIGRFVYLIRSVDDDDNAPFAFTILRVVDDAPSAKIPQVPNEALAEWMTSQYSPLNDALRALYMEVKPRVLGFHSVVGDMFEDLASVDGGSAKPDPMPIPPISDPPF